MRRLSAIFMLMTILAQSLYNTGVMIYWRNNQALITATLCENRNKPALHCDGKCYLKKKLAESPETPVEQQGPAKYFKMGIEFTVMQASAFPFFGAPACEPTVLIPAPCNCRSVFNAGDIFHPPPVPA